MEEQSGKGAVILGVKGYRVRSEKEGFQTVLVCSTRMDEALRALGRDSCVY